MMSCNEWHDYMRINMKRLGLTNERLAKALEVSESTVKAIKKNFPKRMEDIVALAVLFGEDLEKCNCLLKKVGFHGLYGKAPAEAVWIYLLRRSHVNQIEAPAATYRAYGKALLEIFEKQCSEAGDRDRGLFLKLDSTLEKAEKEKKKDLKKKTKDAGQKNSHDNHRFLFRERGALPQVNTLDELALILDMADEANHRGLPVDPAEDVVFLEKAPALMPGFRTPYQGLYKLVYERLAMCAIHRGVKEDVDGNTYIPLVDMFGREFSSRFSTVIMTMLREAVAPSRPFLIALGIRLDMNVDEINGLLSKSGYSYLNGSDFVDAVIISALEEIECYSPFALASRSLWNMPVRELFFPAGKGFDEPLFRDIADQTRWVNRDEWEAHLLSQEDVIHRLCVRRKCDREDLSAEDVLDELCRSKTDITLNEDDLMEYTIAGFVKSRLEAAGETFNEDADAVRRLIRLIVSEGESVTR